MCKVYEAVFPDLPPLTEEEINKGIELQKQFQEYRKGKVMKVINVMEFDQIIAEKVKSLNTDVQLYRNEDSLAADVAEWGISLLNNIRDVVDRKAFEATINQYKSSRNGAG